MNILTVAVEGKPAIEFTAIAWRVSCDAVELIEIYHTFVKQDVELMKKDGFGRKLVHGIPIKTVLRHGLTRAAMKEQLLIFHERYGNCPMFIREKKRLNSLRLKNFHFTQLTGDESSFDVMPERLINLCDSKNHRKKVKGYKSFFNCSLHNAFMLGTVYANLHGLKVYDDLIV